MRFVPTATLLSLIGALTACSDNPTSTPAADSGVTPGADVVNGSDASVETDVPAATDAPAATDVPSMGAINPEVEAFVRENTANNWAVLNRSRNMMMFGCAGAARPQDCLADRPEPGDDDIGAGRSAIAGAHLRVLVTTPNRSTYWTRSSPDGRFIARGTRMYDLQRSVEMPAMGAMYDPAFFPDASGFSYQPGGRLCPMSMLTTGEPTSLAITGAGSECTGSSVSLYQHLGVSLSGEDYWASSAGTAAWDDGGRSVQLTETRRNEPWTATARVSLSLMSNTGSGFRFVSSRNVTTPLQGDAVVSPSGRALMTRYVDEAGAYQGYVLHRLAATRNGNAINAEITELARYPLQGAKVAFSYDERYVVYHHYLGGGAHADDDARELGFTDAGDSGFAGYASMGASNIYILDLLTGRSTRVTTMQPGQYALFPHFRSDGWIYFLVRTLGMARESVIASDAALIGR
ncbi:MAG: hypothetical protein R3A48_26885 [Polyangiales bacterium]